MTDQYVLCLNSGSSSLKFSVYNMGDIEGCLANGAIEEIGATDGSLWITHDGQKSQSIISIKNHEAAIAETFSVLAGLGLHSLGAVGHRVVHGGSNHINHALIDSNLISELKSLIKFAPLHLPSEIRCIEVVSSILPGMKQVACFDTAFHRSMPMVSQMYPLPQKYYDEGIMRYGFHGLSYEYITQYIRGFSKERVVIAHLGNGASLAAVKDGRAIDTTMGLTPTGGLMMGTRTGDIDPGVLIHLLKEYGRGVDDLDRLVNHESGLLGVSGSTNDMKTLLERYDGDIRAKLAVDIFCHTLKKYIASMAASLGGIDMLVFTGGIGERSGKIRSQVCSGIGFLGIEIDENKNDSHAEKISVPNSKCQVCVIPTDENKMIARHTAGIVSEL